MSFPRTSLVGWLSAALIFCSACRAADASAPRDWQATHDQLVQRLRGVAGRENAFGSAYQPLYHAAIPWYELWGGRNSDPVDADMMAPEAYASELAGALEQGRNYFAENPGALFPLVFRRIVPGGGEEGANYWLRLPAGFPSAGRAYPLVIELHGSGWLGHKISFKRTGRSPGPAVMVTPINMGGSWKIDFLNAYLDELISILPIDSDRVYVQGHSLGAMATWEWALDNPERFAAISPRAGIGEPYRAQRLKNVPAWVIHGESDDVIPNGFADEMVTALEAQGAAVRFSIIKGGKHNMPADLDQDQVLEWYLRQARSHAPVPADPRDALGLNESGYSPWRVVTEPETPSWKSSPVNIQTPEAYRAAAAALFKKAHERGDLVDAPIVQEFDQASHMTTLWLAVPKTLHPFGPEDPSIVIRPARRVVRFYLRGQMPSGIDHMLKIRDEVQKNEGRVLAEKVWITSLSIWWLNNPACIAEFCAELK
jgi:pimeloyl-ACP methyl ester carboxylesterase